MGEEFFDDPPTFGWVIEKGRATGVHSMQPGGWLPLHSPARIISPAERLAFSPQKLRRNAYAAQSFCGEFIFRKCAMQRGGGE
jgi:hypothetical protein